MQTRPSGGHGVSRTHDCRTEFLWCEAHLAHMLAKVSILLKLAEWVDACGLTCTTLDLALTTTLKYTAQISSCAAQFSHFRRDLVNRSKDLCTAGSVLDVKTTSSNCHTHSFFPLMQRSRIFFFPFTQRAALNVNIQGTDNLDVSVHSLCKHHQSSTLIHHSMIQIARYRRC